MAAAPQSPISFESQPRSSTSEPPQQGPVSLFDTQLRFLGDSYLSFFQERRRIEELYIDSLQRLHRKAKSIDSYLEERTELNTSRRAWNEVRDSLEREAQARTAFLAALSVDVITPLNNLKETQERSRKRIKEDLKESSVAYQDHAENVLPRLKSKYLKKYQEMDEQKKAALVAPVPVVAQSPISPEVQHTPLVSTRSNPTASSRPVVTSPQPLRALDRRPSGGAPRNRSPSSGTAFSDLAHQGKKQLNQLMGFLDKSGTVKDTLGGRSENPSLRSVRLKREMDETDREYRKGVHWAETLRLRKIKILEAGYKSLEMFIQDSASTLKDVLEKYLHNAVATSTTLSQLSTHCLTAVGSISPEKDISKLSPQFTRSLEAAMPDPIYYQSGAVGICKDLIFGFGLVDYATDKNLQDGQIPKIVRVCIREVDQRGLDAEGIYRVSGRLAAIHQLKHNIERDEQSFKFNHQNDDIYAIASLFKLYLRELPEPVFKFSLQDRIQHTEDIVEHQSNNFILLRAKMRRLPPIHQATLRALIEHLARVAAQSDKNKMDAKNLAIVFGGVIFGEDEIPKNGDLLSVQAWKDSLMEDLINNAHILFDDQGQGQVHPLPATPSGEAPAPTFYGSQHTRVASVPIIPITIRKPSDDFTPQMPAHPAKSIHPSARANPPPSPTKDRATMIPPTPLSPKRRSAEMQLPPQSSGRGRAEIPLFVPSAPSSISEDSTQEGGSSSAALPSSLPPAIGRSSINSALDPFTVPNISTPPTPTP